MKVIIKAYDGTTVEFSRFAGGVQCKFIDHDKADKVYTFDNQELRLTVDVVTSSSPTYKPEQRLNVNRYNNTFFQEPVP